MYAHDETGAGRMTLEELAELIRSSLTGVTVVERDGSIWIDLAPEGATEDGIACVEPAIDGWLVTVDRQVDVPYGAEDRIVDLVTAEASAELRRATTQARKRLDELERIDLTSRGRPISLTELRRVANEVRDLLPGLRVDIDEDELGVTVHMPAGETEELTDVLASAWCAWSSGRMAGNEAWLIGDVPWSAEKVAAELAGLARAALRREAARYATVAAALQAAFQALEGQ